MYIFPKLLFKSTVCNDGNLKKNLGVMAQNVEKCFDKSVQEFLQNSEFFSKTDYVNHCYQVQIQSTTCFNTMDGVDGGLHHVRV